MSYPEWPSDEPDIYKPCPRDYENGSAAFCCVCSEGDYIEFMYNEPEGFYCKECWENR